MVTKFCGLIMDLFLETWIHGFSNNTQKNPLLKNFFVAISNTWTISKIKCLMNKNDISQYNIIDSLFYNFCGYKTNDISLAFNENILIYCSISSVTNGGLGKFVVDPVSGLVTVSGSLDRETTGEYVVTILATDAGTIPGDMFSFLTLSCSIH